ncbi:MAG: molecular chaperone DnaJ [Patescibacteria group bacterium]|nr:MAG: molecular chaperone DnaJ [Patescibacteria group bacterium]
MTNGKDYYKILGIDKNASEEDIKKAYRKLAREHHPDVVSEKDKEAAEKRFKEINEAYRVLSDPEKRKMYDKFGTAEPGKGFGGFGEGFGRSGQWGPFTYTYTTNGGADFGDFDPFDIFESMFGFRGFGQRTPKRGKNLYYQMDITFREAVFGVEKDINIESGRVRIKIPAGARDGLELKFAGKGMPGPGGAPAGDLFLTLRVSYPQEFRVSGDDVLVLADVDIVTAALGGVIEVPVVDLSRPDAIGKAKLRIPAGTQHGTRFAVRGKGMPRLHGRGQGDVLVQVNVVVPRRLNKKQKDLLEAFGAARE